MIRAIGIDAVEINRFCHWHTKSYASLRRLFSDEEIRYCMSIKICAAERFAVRFAAREAFSKVLHTLIAPHGIPFLRVCRAVSVQKQASGVPYLVINWSNLLPEDMRFAWYRYDACHQYTYHLSLTHTKQIATALIIAEHCPNLV